MKCPICNKEMGDKDPFCKFCWNYHQPEKCTGEDCQICKEIKYLADEGKL